MEIMLTRSAEGFHECMLNLHGHKNFKSSASSYPQPRHLGGLSTFAKCKWSLNSNGVETWNGDRQNTLVLNPHQQKQPCPGKITVFLRFLPVYSVNLYQPTFQNLVCDFSLSTANNITDFRFENGLRMLGVPQLDALAYLGTKTMPLI